MHAVSDEGSPFVQDKIFLGVSQNHQYHPEQVNHYSNKHALVRYKGLVLYHPVWNHHVGKKSDKPRHDKTLCSY